MSRVTHLLKLLSGPLSGILVWWLLISAGEESVLAKTAGVAVWMAVWWITEAIPIYFTAFLPAIFFPFLGIMSMKEIAPAYLPQIIFLFIGGFILAFALERWNLHKRIALKIIVSLGDSPSRLLLGFMLSSYLLSMWILNTATVMMLLPALLAVLDQMKNTSNKKAAPYLLGLAFASSIGGTASLIGTAPNLYFADFFNENFTQYPPITFANWFMFGFPVSLVFFVLAFWVIRFIYFRKESEASINIDHCREQYKSLGRITYEEKMVGVLFVLTVLLWFFSKDIAIGDFKMSGWTNLLPEGAFVKESTIAMLTAFLLFVLPSKNEKGNALIAWKDVRKMPIGVIFLFGGGFALAKGIGDSGLSDWLAGHLEIVSQFPGWLVIICLCLFMTFFTEITSNTASIVLILPVLMAMSTQIDAHPLMIMLPVTFSASFAFMLPVATPPNTLVFGSDRLEIREMVRTGIWLNFIGAVLILGAVFTLGKLVYGF